MLGLPKGIVKLEPHTEHGRQLFAEEAARREKRRRLKAALAVCDPANRWLQKL